MSKVVPFKPPIKKRRGILTGCDQTQEWMLKWWLSHAQKNTDLPISIIDFGLSKSAKAYLENKVHLIEGKPALEPFKGGSRYLFPKNWPLSWQKSASLARPFYFAKILATQHSPYDESIWIDLDCKIIDSPIGAFAYIDDKYGACLALDAPDTVNKWRSYNFIKTPCVGYQAGVIPFKKGSLLMKTWRDLCLSHYHKEFSDQTVIINYLAGQHRPLKTLPSYFNYLFPKDKVRMGIAHYGGQWHKLCLLKEINTLT